MAQVVKRRSETRIWLLGQSLDTLKFSQLPTNGDVLRYFIKKYKCSQESKNRVAIQVLNSIMKIWDLAAIPTKAFSLAHNQILKLHTTWINLRDSQDRNSKNNLVQQSYFTQDMEKLFDLSAQNVENVIRQDKLRSKEAQEECIAFLIDQRDGLRKQKMQNIDRIYKYNKRKELLLEKKNERKAVSGKRAFDSENCEDTVNDKRDQGSNNCIPLTKRCRKNDNVDIKLPRKISQSTLLTEAADKLDLSNNQYFANIASPMKANSDNMSDFATSIPTAFAILRKALASELAKLKFEDLFFSKNMDMFPSLVQDNMPRSNSISLEANLNNQPSTCVLTGPRKKLVGNAIPIDDKQQDYKVISISIKDTCILKTEYLRLYRKHDILALEKKCNCQIEIEAIMESETFTPQLCKTISIKCYELYKDEINRQIHKMIGGIIVEKEESVSLHSRIGRLFHCSKKKLEDYQKEYQCLLILTDHQGRRIKNKLDSAAANLKRAGTKLAPIKSEAAEEISVANASQGIASSQSDQDERRVNNVVIKLRKGTIEKEGTNCHVIVNSINLQKYQNGKIAAAIYKVGGSAYEQECCSKLQGLTVDGIGCTSGSYIGCKSIYHIPFLSSDKSLAWLSNRVNDCLTQADRQGMNSIAIPTIGTGGIGLDANDVAKEMMKVALAFARPIKRNLKEIHFIVYPSDSNCYTAYQQALKETHIQQELVKTDSSAESNTQQQLVKTDSSAESNTQQQTVKTDSSAESNTQQQLVKTLTKSANGDKLDPQSVRRLLFSAQSKTTKISVDIHVYHGIVNDVKTDAIIDMTALCSKHATTDNYVDIANYADIRHASQTLRCPQLSESSNIYQVCPYGCVAGFSTLLACINARGEKSVTIPLLDIEMNAAIIDSLVDSIESFMMNHLEDNNGINCFNFVIGYQDRSSEIATWMQDKLTNKTLQFKWTVVQQVSMKNFGINIHYVASNKTALDNMKSSMMRYSNTWACHVIANEDYFDTIQPKLWYQLALKIWSEYNTIVIRRDTSSTISIFGYETDIINTVSHIHNLSKTYLAEKAQKEVQQFVAETAQWYATIDSSRIKFETKLNYEIEKNYNIYCKDKTKKIFIIDSGSKIVNYESLKIKDAAKGKEYLIRKSTLEEIAIPDNWKYDEKEDIIDGYYSLVDVQNQQEINEISNIPELGGLAIKKLQRIQNWNLYRRYQIMKAEVTEAVKKYASNTKVERRLFHGTASSKLNAICKSGFDRDYSGTAAGSAHGTGTYFAVKADLSRNYGNILLLVRVLTGVCTQSCKSGKPNLAIIPGSQSERVHSVVDNAANPSMYVISNDNSAYPEYILHV